jgi:hypothetical protein
MQNKKRSAPALAALTALGLMVGAAAAPAAAQQQSGSVPPTPATGGAAAPTTPGAPPPGGPPPIPVLLGYADFMLTLDRPWRAEELYKLILLQEPDNAAAKAGLRAAQNQQKIGFTFLGHSYYDSEDTQMFAYGGGPVLKYPFGKITITAGDGYYKNNNNPNNKRNPLALNPEIPSAEDNFALDKQTYNLLLESFWGKNMQHEGSVWLSQQNYDRVPDRFLYDVRYSYIPEPGRKKFTIGTGKKDSFYQNQVNQFLAPESYFMLRDKITFNDYYAGVEYPLGRRFDFTFNYRFFDYSDGNERNNFRTQFLYRIKPDDPMRPMPIWRVGLDGVIDEAKFFTLTYGIPRDFRSLSIATDYTFLSRDLKYVLYLSYPVWDKNFAAPAGLVGYVSKNFGSDNRYEVYGKAVILEARNLSISLYDYVLGISTRF